MEKMILSLKSVYKILMTNDYPIYSESVIGKKNRKGQTLLRFWQSILADEFRCLPYGKMIWRNDGKRNRYISNLCNRNEELKFYHEYAKEIASQISTTSLLNQIRRFSEFLLDREYKSDILLRRIREVLRLWEEEDSCTTEEIRMQIRAALSSPEWVEKQGVQGSLFQAGYLLTVMTLYAAAGEAMGDPVMSVLHSDAYTMETLWETQLRQQERSRSAVTFLTAHVGLLQDNPLPQNHFFGREEALFDLLEMSSQGKKCLISGIGGIGKTELLRQLIRRCTEDHLVDQIAVVPYQVGAAESFDRAFPIYRQQTPEESFQYTLLQLKREAENSRIMLLLDDLTNGMDDDPTLRKLLELPCTVLITSRRAQLEGFESYYLAPPSPATGTLIFRDNYGHPLTRENRAELSELLQNKMLCHPLTLRLMAKAAQSKKWSVAQLKAHLQQNGISLTWMEEERTLRLEQMYSQLYSMGRIPEDSRDLAQLFTLLPLESYDKEFLEKVFPSIAGSGLTDKLAALTEGGWLDMGESGYSMHPLIAQCLRRKVITESRLNGIMSDLRRHLPELVYWNEQDESSGDIPRICRILIHIVGFMTGSISKALMMDILTAMQSIVVTKSVSDRYCSFLDQLTRRCTDWDDTVDILYHTILGRWNPGDTGAFADLFRRQKACRTVETSYYLNFCLAAGSQLRLEQPELAEEALREVLCEEAAPQQKAKAYYNLAALADVRGNAETVLAWCELGAKYAQEHPECGEQTAFDNIASLAMLYVKFGRKDDLPPLLEILEKMTRNNQSFHNRVNYLDLKGSYELYFGSLEAALECMREAVDWYLEYTGKSYNYYVALGQMAIVLQRMKRYEEAREIYEEAIAYGETNRNFSHLSIFQNNLAVLYLDMGRPEDALPYLEKSLVDARKMGGIALGEGQRNMARAYGLLGDMEKEYACLLEATPLLEGAYGTDHPRAQAARQRLAELQDLINR